MKLILILIVTLGFFSNSPAQTTPAQWIGQWQGELEIYNYRQAQPEKVNMQMNITAINDSTWHWVTYYTEDERIISEKNYQLVTIDANAGLYQVDELNGIKLQAQMLGSRLITYFEVGNNLLTICYFTRQNQLFFEVNFANNKTKLETGGVSDEVPVVLTYRASTFQQAILSKVKN